LRDFGAMEAAPQLELGSAAPVLAEARRSVGLLDRAANAKTRQGCERCSFDEFSPSHLIYSLSQLHNLLSKTGNSEVRRQKLQAETSGFLLLALSPAYPARRSHECRAANFSAGSPDM